MKVGFLNNQIDNRGTGNAVFNYAHYNEKILGNESVIFTFPSGNHDIAAVDKYTTRFKYIYNITSDNIPDIDVLYHIKSGEDDGFRPPKGIPYLVHAVFTGNQPHGDRYVAVSEWMGKRDNIPFVPHMVLLPEVKEDFRKSLGIPENDLVFGRIGGYDSFDVPFIWEAIKEVLEYNEDIWFLFVNTPIGLKHERIKYFPSTSDEVLKAIFIKTCDAMLHARQRGETFGISVGEFSSQGKHIFTYGKSYEKAHFYELRGTAIKYESAEGLIDEIARYRREPAHKFYLYTPEKVMAQFKEEFLDAS